MGNYSLMGNYSAFHPCSALFWNITSKRRRKALWVGKFHPASPMGDPRDVTLAPVWPFPQRWGCVRIATRLSPAPGLRNAITQIRTQSWGGQCSPERLGRDSTNKPFIGVWFCFPQTKYCRVGFSTCGLSGFSYPAVQHRNECREKHLQRWKD